jgi:hypothetical protein
MYAIGMTCEKNYQAYKWHYEGYYDDGAGAWHEWPVCSECLKEVILYYIPGLRPRDMIAVHA